jgi:ABC-type lipoprotein release transport system permease subunit
MILYLRLAWRNLWRHRRRTFIVVVSVGFCLGMMVFYDGMIGGFEQAIYGNAINVLGGNLQVHASGYNERPGQKPLLPLQDDQAVLKAALARPEVLAASRRIVTGGLASNRKGAFAVGIIGIEPEKEQTLSLVAQHVFAGRFLNSNDLDMIYIGNGLAKEMEVTVGDRITLSGRDTRDQMRSRTMTVVGIYDVGLSDLEKQNIYISLAEAQDLYGLRGQSTEVMVSLKQIGTEPAVMRALNAQLQGYEIDTWQTSFPYLESAINTKSGVMNIFGIIIVAIAGIGILNMLMMAVYERTREIGVIGALGMKPGQISALFLIEGALMGVIGVVIGVGMGLAINLIIGKVGLDFSSYTNLTDYMALLSGKVYTTPGLDNLPQRTLAVLVISLLSALYPAAEAARNEPAESLHYV